MTPLEKVEVLFDELVAHYGEANDKEIRAAAKLLLVAVDRMRAHGGPRWTELVAEYVALAEEDPDKFERVLRGNQSTPRDTFLA